jgi:exopolysaccharide biosynthesis polyprenyl glycosylphosphotransferase
MSRQHLIDYRLRAGTPLGRARLTLRQDIKRGLWIGTVHGTRLVKRTLDAVVATVALVALLPVFAVTALAIKREDRGPIFFRQQRVGLQGRLFGMWKFRSMSADAEKQKDRLARQNEMQGGVTFKMKNDPRVTRVGRFIRKYSIDELPQFWNVLCGDMSLVGPRPPVPREVALYSPEARLRLQVVPGLTCFWQVGGRSAIDFEGQVRLDVAYIRSASVWLDLKLLVQTVPAVLFGKGAY